MWITGKIPYASPEKIQENPENPDKSGKSQKIPKNLKSSATFEWVIYPLPPLITEDWGIIAFVQVFSEVSVLDALMICALFSGKELGFRYYILRYFRINPGWPGCDTSDKNEKFKTKMTFLQPSYHAHFFDGNDFIRISRFLCEMWEFSSILLILAQNTANL